MEPKLQTFLNALLLLSLCLSAAGQTCTNHNFANNEVFAACVDHPVLNSFLHWTFHPSNATLRMAFRRPSTSPNQWIAWAINPNALAMFGSQALIAYRNSSALPHVYTSSIDLPSPTMQQTRLSFEVPQLSATYLDDEMTIFATISLPPGMTTVNQVWQEGPMAQGSPLPHAFTGDNRRSLATLDLLTGSTTAAVDSVLRRRNIHGVLNAVSWGTLMPMGAIFARYLKVFKAADPAWFYLHVACQTSAYAVGVAGWATGIKLGGESAAVQYNTHRNIGIALFVLGSVQVFALLLRPKKDHKYRIYWNIYHHSMGYSVIIMSIINVFEGFKILSPDNKWRRAYSGVIILLGAVALVLEAVTWFIVIKRRRSNSNKFPHNISAHTAKVENRV
ncbi:cytochrome b561 and DOMON domain-containing protein At5g47530-like [Cucurbita maxima]|uniref:Cytochrome b561 and DOMON domain-containing protein n=1 Tax=Cucurbita maxima TaxID=3661 RepID=A0A6J1JK09_CUCMA|nr:cytochrome b561 and DOMON domain-containing protein At5g47530-like [Cucurbita maxima]XP_022989421.1 cytochrome b561 and DOMON domain-containing protein At5g47530-like [Cucurbita maxima]XP_022989422.1 cytochrome b561 and DOMON domain-containing protein At5g47530-like [Cucurbita maxima]